MSMDEGGSRVPDRASEFTVVRYVDDSVAGEVLGRFPDAEQAVGFVADLTGRHPEHVAEETRAGHSIPVGEDGTMPVVCIEDSQ